jgi:anionic cell wall polymer biosynthesis LytR-Cps2A-Psr (LCP) family protein
LNFNNFIEIVDELGGIDVDVLEYVSDWPITIGLLPYYGVEFVPAWTWTAKGRWPTRMRKTDNDFRRIERQR